MSDTERHDPERTRSSGDHGSEEPTPLGEQIAAYVCGDMATGEAAAFERRMQSEAGLRREVEAWREALAAAEEWAGEDVPGVERVEDLAVPSLPSPGLWRRFRTSLRLGGATVRFRSGWVTAGVFIAGFLLGALLFRQGATTRDSDEGVNGPERVTVSRPEEDTGTSRNLEPRESPSETTPVVEPNGEDQGMRVAAAARPRYVTQDDGRMVVETTLAKSGARVVMVVDGGFRIENAETEAGGRTQ